MGAERNRIPMQPSPLAHPSHFKAAKMSLETRVCVNRCNRHRYKERRREASSTLATNGSRSQKQNHTSTKTATGGFRLSWRKFLPRQEWDPDHSWGVRANGRILVRRLGKGTTGVT